MSKKQNQVLKKESTDSDVIFVNTKIDLTQTPSSSEYETSITHISESKDFKG